MKLSLLPDQDSLVTSQDRLDPTRDYCEVAGSSGLHRELGGERTALAEQRQFSPSRARGSKAHPERPKRAKREEVRTGLRVSRSPV